MYLQTVFHVEAIYAVDSLVPDFLVRVRAEKIMALLSFNNLYLP